MNTPHTPHPLTPFRTLPTLEQALTITSTLHRSGRISSLPIILTRLAVKDSTGMFPFFNSFDIFNTPAGALVWLLNNLTTDQMEDVWVEIQWEVEDLRTAALEKGGVL